VIQNINNIIIIIECQAAIPGIRLLDILPRALFYRRSDGIGSERETRLYSLVKWVTAIILGGSTIDRSTASA
jgi:hypothetical protein